MRTELLKIKAMKISILYLRHWSLQLSKRVSLLLRATINIFKNSTVRWRAWANVLRFAHVQKSSAIALRSGIALSENGSHMYRCRRSNDRYEKKEPDSRACSEWSDFMSIVKAI